MRVEVVYAPRPGQVECVALDVPPGTTLGQALSQSGLPARFPEVAALPAGVWGRLQAPDTPLRERDRVEVYRPLRVDPKEARRQRYKGQAARKKA